MSLNDIHLTSHILSTLYPHSIVELPGEKIEKKEPDAVTSISENPGSKWKYLGANQKNILVMVDYPDTVHLPDEELSFLTSMLTACKLSLADVVIINRNNYKETPYKELISHFKSKIIFLFGVDPVSFGLPVSFPHFQVQPFANASFLYAPPLEERKKDELLKSKLWVSLRRIFGI